MGHEGETQDADERDARHRRGSAVGVVGPKDPDDDNGEPGRYRDQMPQPSEVIVQRPVSPAFKLPELFVVPHKVIE